jgi:hypothetical protein
MPVELLNMILTYVVPEYSFTMRSTHEVSASYVSSIINPAKSCKLNDLLLVSKCFSRAVMKLISLEGLDLNIHIQNGSFPWDSNQRGMMGNLMAVISERMRATPPQNLRNIKVHLQPGIKRSKKGLSSMYQRVVRDAGPVVVQSSRFLNKALEKMLADGVVPHRCTIKVICYETSGLHAAALDPMQAPPMPVWNLGILAAALGPWCWLFTRRPGLWRLRVVSFCRIWPTDFPLLPMSVLKSRKWKIAIRSLMPTYAMTYFEGQAAIHPLKAPLSIMHHIYSGLLPDQVSHTAACCSQILKMA